MSGKRLVVITGASSGIGEATAKAFSREGYPLLLVGRRGDRLKALGFDRAMCAAVDVTDRSSFEKAIQAAEREFGPADCLINNAGLMLLGQADVQSPEEWKKMFDVNVLALLTGMQLVLPGMKSRNRGTIINISSIAGRKTFPNHAAYCGTKFAVHAISENVREEVAGSNVRITVVAPGAVETELLAHTTSNEIKSNYSKWKESMGGALAPHDIARAIVFAYEAPQSVCIREVVLAATQQGA